MAYYYDGDSEPGSTHDGWYLPGVGEMRVIGKNRDDINGAFPSGVTHNDVSSDAEYWVSQDSKTETGNGRSEAVRVHIQVGDKDHLKVDGKDKRDSQKLRIVKEIGG